MAEHDFDKKTLRCKRCGTQKPTGWDEMMYGMIGAPCFTKAEIAAGQAWNAVMDKRSKPSGYGGIRCT